MRPTAGAHDRRMRRLDRLNPMIDKTLREMRDRNAILHLEFTRNGERWFLSNGSRLLDDVARAVIRDQHVVATDYGLFRDGRGQSWCCAGGMKSLKNKESHHGE